jgi:hypothetical protein
MKGKPQTSLKGVWNFQQTWQSLTADFAQPATTVPPKPRAGLKQHRGSSRFIASSLLPTLKQTKIVHDAAARLPECCPPGAMRTGLGALHLGRKLKARKTSLWAVGAARAQGTSSHLQRQGASPHQGPALLDLRAKAHVSISLQTFAITTS